MKKLSKLLFMLVGIFIFFAYTQSSESSVYDSAGNALIIEVNQALELSPVATIDGVNVSTGELLTESYYLNQFTAENVIEANVLTEANEATESNEAIKLCLAATTGYEGLSPGTLQTNNYNLNQLTEETTLMIEEIEVLAPCPVNEGKTEMAINTQNMTQNMTTAYYRQTGVLNLAALTAT